MTKRGVAGTFHVSHFMFCNYRMIVLASSQSEVKFVIRGWCEIYIEWSLYNKLIRPQKFINSIPNMHCGASMTTTYALKILASYIIKKKEDFRIFMSYHLLPFANPNLSFQKRTTGTGKKIKINLSAEYGVWVELHFYCVTNSVITTMIL